MFPFFVIRGGLFNSGPHKARIYQRTRKREPSSLRTAHNRRFGFCAGNEYVVRAKTSCQIRATTIILCRRADTRERASERIIWARAGAPGVFEDSRSSHLYTRYARVETARRQVITWCTFCRRSPSSAVNDRTLLAEISRRP